MMRTPPMGRGMPRPMQMGGEVDIFGYEDASSVPRQTNIAGQPHMLAYINQDEEENILARLSSGAPTNCGSRWYSLLSSMVRV
jgi:hypothetical protein